MECLGNRTYLAGEALARRRRVKIVGSEMMYSDAGEEYFGVTPYALADGDYGTVREKTLGGTFEMTASGAISVGARVYGSADGKISATKCGKSLGIALEEATANNDIIEILAVDEVLDYEATVNTADSAAIGTSSTAEADFAKTVTIKGADLQVGDIIRVRALVSHTGTYVTTETLTVKLYLGTEQILTSGALTLAAQGDVVMIEADIVVRATGATGTLSAVYKVLSKLNATIATSVLGQLAPATEDISGDTVLKLSGQYSASNANNSAVLEHLAVEVIKAKAA